MKTFLGIDLGTSSVKVVGVDKDGGLLGSASRSYPLYSPASGWVEQDPTDWWSATADAIRELLDAHPQLEVVSIGLSGQMHGLVPLDASGVPLRPAILWNDNRTGDQVAEIIDRVGGKGRLIELTNNASLTGFTAGKILWMQQHEPELFAQVRHLVLPKDYLRFRMTGVVATDVSDASGTGIFDVRARTWSSEVVAALDLHESLFPAVYESHEVTGAVSPNAAEELGLAPGIPVVAGGGDSVLQTTSMGVFSEGAMGITIGTAGIVAQAVEYCPENPDGLVQVSCGNEPGRWHIMGVALTCGETVPWLKRVLEPVRPDIDITDIVQLAEGVEPGSRGLRFAPHLVGERCPHQDPTLRAAWLGMDIRHTIADMARASIEGSLFNLRQICDLFESLGLQSQEIRTSGRAMKYPLWTQTLSDILDAQIGFVRGGEGGAAYGAACLAGIGVGHWKNLHEALSHVGIETRTTPDTEAAAVYDKAYAEFRSMQPGLHAVCAARHTEE